MGSFIAGVKVLASVAVLRLADEAVSGVLMVHTDLETGMRSRGL